jgi:large subunit ribosomal protein L4
MEIEVFNTKGKAVGKLDLPETMFGIKPRKGFLSEAVEAFLANQREGNASTKTRAEVSGGGKKPWKQKGTGRARHGSNRSPLWRHGGITFGPKPRSYRQGFTPAKAQLALLQALSAKMAEGAVQVVETFEPGKPKTKEVAAFLNNLEAPHKTLLVTDAASDKLRTASRNLRGFLIERAIDLTAYYVLDARKIIFTKAGLDILQTRLAAKAQKAEKAEK